MQQVRTKWLLAGKLSDSHIVVAVWLVSGQTVLFDLAHNVVTWQFLRLVVTVKAH